MSQRAYPWLKLMKDTKRDPKIARLSLEQQAVFYNLLQHAGLQEEEGAFEDCDRAELAIEVADARQDILDSTIEWLLKYGVLIRVNDRTLEFADSPNFAFRNFPELIRLEFQSLAPVLRPVVFRRDNFLCQKCGARYPREVDHVIPVALGGTNDLENLQTLCQTCNRRKGARL